MTATQPNNLRPYGYAGTSGTPAAGGDPAVVIQRATAKFHAARTGAVQPAGADVPATILVSLLALVPTLLFGLGAYAFAADRNPAGALILAAIALAFMSMPVLVHATTRPSNPKAAFKAFLRAVARGRLKRARRLVIDADLDDFPRVQPIVPELGRPTGMAHAFFDEQSFKGYWKGLLRWRQPCYCLVGFKDLQVTQVSPYIALVEARVKFTMNTSLWLLLITVALLIAVLVDIATQTRVVVPVRKVLVRVGDEWRIFNAELMGADEHDLSWLGTAA